MIKRSWLNSNEREVFVAEYVKIINNGETNITEALNCAMQNVLPPEKWRPREMLCALTRPTKWFTKLEKEYRAGTFVVEKETEIIKSPVEEEQEVKEESLVSLIDKHLMKLIKAAVKQAINEELPTHLSFLHEKDNTPKSKKIHMPNVGVCGMLQSQFIDLKNKIADLKKNIHLVYNDKPEKCNSLELCMNGKKY